MDPFEPKVDARGMHVKGRMRYTNGAKSILFDVFD